MKTLLNKLLRKPAFWLVLALIILGATTYTLGRENVKSREEIERLGANQQTLLGEVAHYETENGKLAASVQSLTLQRDEFKSLMPQYERTIKDLRIRVKDLESLGEVGTETDVEITAPVTPTPDTVYIANEPLARQFSWDDGYVALRGELSVDSVRIHLKINDTITIVAHRPPRGWWIFKCRGKITHYTAISANPHTQINQIKYIELNE